MTSHLIYLRIGDHLDMIYHNTYNPDNDAIRNIIKNYDPLSIDNVSGYNNPIKGIDNYDSGINLKLIENIANTEKYVTTL